MASDLMGFIFVSTASATENAEKEIKEEPDTGVKAAEAGDAKKEESKEVKTETKETAEESMEH